MIAEPFVTHGGATVSSYAASHAPINPGLPAPRHVLTGPQRSTSPSPTISQTPPSTAGSASIFDVSPDSGSTAAGDIVIIIGTGFTDATGVQFGDVSAQNFTRNSDAQITGTSPAGMGTVDIVVISAGHIADADTGDQFTYVPTSNGTAVTATPTPTP